jgi:hypothetical protein
MSLLFCRHKNVNKQFAKMEIDDILLTVDNYFVVLTLRPSYSRLCISRNQCSDSMKKLVVISETSCPSSLRPLYFKTLDFPENHQCSDEKDPSLRPLYFKTLDFHCTDELKKLVVKMKTRWKWKLTHNCETSCPDVFEAVVFQDFGFPLH